MIAGASGPALLDGRRRTTTGRADAEGCARPARRPAGTCTASTGWRQLGRRTGGGGMIVATSWPILRRTGNDVTSRRPVRESSPPSRAKLDRLVSGRHRGRSCCAGMQDIMTAKVGIFRTGATELAVTPNCSAAGAQPAHRPAAQDPCANPNSRPLPHAEGSAGAVHCHGAPRAPRARAAFRETSRAAKTACAQAHAATLAGESDTLPRWPTNADVKAMELPPLARYGAKAMSTTRHAGRPAEVRVAERSATHRAYAVQQALMPYEDLLPASCAGATTASTTAG